MNYVERLAGAQAYYQAACKRAETTPPPESQKYLSGTRVRIADDLGPDMAHFPKGKDATVLYTYAHAYGGEDVKSYCLDIDGYGKTAWYPEECLTQLTAPSS